MELAKPTDISEKPDSEVRSVEAEVMMTSRTRIYDKNTQGGGGKIVVTLIKQTECSCVEQLEHNVQPKTVNVNEKHTYIYDKGEILWTRGMMTCGCTMDGWLTNVAAESTDGETNFWAVGLRTQINGWELMGVVRWWATKHGG